MFIALGEHSCGTRLPSSMKLPVEWEQCIPETSEQVDVGQVLPRIPFDSGGPIGEGICLTRADWAPAPGWTQT